MKLDSALALARKAWLLIATELEPPTFVELSVSLAPPKPSPEKLAKAFSISALPLPEGVPVAVSKSIVPSLNLASKTLLSCSSFANLSFCKSGTKVVEIRANETRKIIESIAKNNNLNFNALNYNPEKLSDKQNGVIKVSLDELEKAIKH